MTSVHRCIGVEGAAVGKALEEGAISLDLLDLAFAVFDFLAVLLPVCVAFFLVVLGCNRILAAPGVGCTLHTQWPFASTHDSPSFAPP